MLPVSTLLPREPRLSRADRRANRAPSAGYVVGGGGDALGCSPYVNWLQHKLTGAVSVQPFELLQTDLYCSTGAGKQAERKPVCNGLNQISRSASYTGFSLAPRQTATVNSKPGYPVFSVILTRIIQYGLTTTRKNIHIYPLPWQFQHLYDSLGFQTAVLSWVMVVCLFVFNPSHFYFKNQGSKLHFHRIWW